MRLIKHKKDLSNLVAHRLNKLLEQNARVIWLVSGGSNIPISVDASRLINKVLASKLVIMQTDERFVPINSPNCNWKQLIDAGFIVGDAEVLPIIIDESSTLEQTAERYNSIVINEFAKSDCIYGQFGIGGDGHIAGVKPETVATTAVDMVTGYRADDFARITLTFDALLKVNYADVFAYGDSKKSALEKLKSNNTSLDILPSGILWKIEKSTVYNDQIEN